MEKSWEEKIIEAGYRRLARQNHPDRGGNEQSMAGLNAAVEKLRSQFGEPAAADGKSPHGEIGRDCPACGIHDSMTLKARPFKEMPCPVCGFSGSPNPEADELLAFLYELPNGPQPAGRRGQRQSSRRIAQVISGLIERGVHKFLREVEL